MMFFASAMLFALGYRKLGEVFPKFSKFMSDRDNL
jgi:hypothetical protein